LQQYILSEELMTVQASAGPGAELYADGSPASDMALEELRTLMNQVGFTVARKVRGHSTLRAYPVRMHQYPLLNPRFVRSAATFLNLDIAPDVESLVISTLSRSADPDFRGRLHAFSSSADIAFLKNPHRVSGYHCYGYFVIATIHRDDAAEELDFFEFHQPLSTILDFLRACPVPRNHTADG
jgi:hypothetical protein